MSTPARPTRIGIDVGGTFTDFVIVRDGDAAPQYLKEPSTPAEPSEAVVRGITRIISTFGIPASDIVSIAHGTTIGLNAIIQRKGARVGLVTSEGHRDVLEMTRRLPEQYNLRQPHPEALVPRHRVVEIAGRLDARGEVLQAPSVAEIDRVASRLRELEVESVAVTVLHSYLNPAFEIELADAIQARLDGIPVIGSSSIWPEIREYNRTSVGALNAYIAPLMQRYLANLQEKLTSIDVTCPIYITASNGGSLGVASAAERAVDTILSGPASGVTATLILAEAAGLDQVISFDMGGTSSDIAIATTGQAEYSTRAEVGGIPLILPVVDVSAIGAGGGSIAHIDSHGRVAVGPESAGAFPGPAAYGLGGTRPTITDAYLVNGILAADRFLGGEKHLDAEAARAAFAPIADQLEHGAAAESINIAAESILTLATVGMGSELQKVLSRRGYDASEFTLVPFGGAGPTHAAFLAEEAGIRSIAVPLAAGTYCALGAVGAPIRRDYLLGIGRPLGPDIARSASAALAGLIDEGREWVSSQGSIVETIELRASFEMRYAGQAFELDVPIDESELPLDATAIENRFHDVHVAEFGQRDDHSAVIMLSARLTAIGTVRAVDLGAVRSKDEGEGGTRPVFFRGKWLDAVQLSPGALARRGAQAGPAVVDLPHTTIFVPPQWIARLSAGNSITLDRN